MENSKLHKIKQDLRQSSAWANHLQDLGWKKLEIPDHSNLFIRKFPVLGSVAKLQRPDVLSKEILDNVDELMNEHNIFFIKIEPGPNTPTKILEQYEYTKGSFPLLPPATILINLNNPKKELDKKLSKGARYSIRKAGKDSIKVEIIKDPAEIYLEKFYKILESSADKNNIEAPSMKKLKSLIKHFGENAFLALARNSQDDLTGGNLFLSYKNTVWYLYGGINELGRKDTSGYKLMWDSILYFKKEGFDFLDLGGIEDTRFPKHTKNWEGFSVFKRRFGGRIVKFPEPYIKTKPKFLKIFLN